MDLFKVSLLLFSAVLHVHPSSTNKIPKLLQYNTKKVISLPDDNKHCVCYPDGQLPTVHQLLDSQNNGQERVVIYLYRNVGTNEIKMYTPNADKQALIPDLPYESSDGLVTVTTENVYTLFYNNQYKIKVYNDHTETLIPPVTDSLPIGLNVGEIEHIFPNGDNHFNSNNNDNGNEDSFNENIIASGPNGDSQKGSTYPKNFFFGHYDINNLETPKQYWTSNNMKYPYAKPQATTDNPQTLPLNPQASSGNTQAFPHDPQFSPYKLQAFPYNSQASPEIVQEFPGNSQAIPGDSQVIQGNSQAITGNSQAIPGNSQTVPGNPQAFPHNIAFPGNPQVFPGSYIRELDQHIVFQTDQGSSKFPSGSQDNNNRLSTQYITFNIWFNQQMKRFQNIHLLNDIKTIDSKVLRILVQKTLFENNIHISANGVITDSKGVVIDAANLELRPLLLGQSFNHQIPKNVHKKIKLPKHLPYLEGILVTLVSPPQILGIIPLGKTYLPETSYMGPSLAGSAVNGSKMYVNSYSTSSNSPTLTVKASQGPASTFANSGAKEASGSFYSEVYGLPHSYSYPIGNKKPEHGVSEVNYWSSEPYTTDSKLSYPSANWNSSEIIHPIGQSRKLADTKIRHHYEAPQKNQKKGKGLKKTAEVTTAEPFLSINSLESGRFPAPSLTDIMKTLLYLLNEQPSRRSSNSTEEVDIVNESENNNDGGVLDFKIIGGNAATGSGTPLSNKGRSGNTESA